MTLSRPISLLQGFSVVRVSLRIGCLMSSTDAFKTVELQLIASSYSYPPSWLSFHRHKTCPTSLLALVFYVPRLSRISINTLWTSETLIQWSTMYDNWKSRWLPRSGEKLPSNLTSNATVGQHKLTPPPTPDTSIAAAQC